MRSRTGWSCLCLTLVLAAQGVSCRPGLRGQGTIVPQVVPSGPARVWQTLTLDFVGPVASQTDQAPNPFLDYRLQVSFTSPEGRTTVVPGFFDGDGEGGPRGQVWRVRFTPDRAGSWRYLASFRRGPGVAVDLAPTAGAPAGFDGATGSITIAERDPKAPGVLALGRLEHDGTHYLAFRDGGPWLKGGTDDPENFLGYAGFDDAQPGKFGLHRYQPHERDWAPGDPDWGGGRGRGIIGALNYLAAQKVNSIFFLVMNIGGDGQDTWPYVGPIKGEGSPQNDNLHFHLGRLRQWEMVFAHAQRRGIVLHVVLNEAEDANKRELDDGELGVERKLYYRELVARFGHHNALIWNLCEEFNLNFDLGPERIKNFAAYLQAQDPYDHPITVHNEKKPLEAWGAFFGDPRFSLASLQYHPDGRKFGALSYEDLVEEYRRRSRAAGRPIAVGLDEFDRLGKKDDDARGDTWPFLSGQSRLRKGVLWPVLLSGGQLEYITEDLLQLEDFRVYEPMWRYTAHARAFLEALPFARMEPDDALVSGASDHLGGAQLFHKAGEVYAVYLPRANPSGTLDLRAAPGRFVQRWFDPRRGRFEGTPREIDGGGPVSLGPPPAEPDQDWAVLITAQR